MENFLRLNKYKIIILLFIIFLLLFYFYKTKFDIISRNYYYNATVNGDKVRGYSIITKDELESILQQYSLNISSLKLLNGEINFKKQFVILSENSELVDIFDRWPRGNISFAILKRKNGKGVGIAVVKGPKRIIKIVEE